MELITSSLLLLIPFAAILGWHNGRKKSTQTSLNSATSLLPQDYFVGLNYLINEQPDQAVDAFIKMLEVTQDTFETHLALGSLFRQRGEVDRAIRVHQNLIARPELHKLQRIQGLTELAQDYLRAGVLDRAEKLFLELVESKGNIIGSLNFLLHIYQQQKDWVQAIAIAKQIEIQTQRSMQVVIAHYYCELAEQSREKNQGDRVQEYLAHALQINPHCVRASFLAGEIAVSQGQWHLAIKYYKKIKNQDPDFISEMIFPLAQCYEKLQREKALFVYLTKCLQEYPRISLLLMQSEHLRKYQGIQDAIDYLAQQIQNYPSLRGLEYLVKLYLEKSQQESRRDLIRLCELIGNLLVNKPNYRCQQCGLATKTLYWQCPQCRQWSVVKPILGMEGD